MFETKITLSIIWIAVPVTSRSEKFKEQNSRREWGWGLLP